MGCETDGSFVLLQDGKTALMFASKWGHIGVLELLLDAKVDIEAAQKVGSRGASHHLDLHAIVVMSHSLIYEVRD